MRVQVEQVTLVIVMMKRGKTALYCSRFHACSACLCRLTLATARCNN